MYCVAIRPSSLRVWADCSRCISKCALAVSRGVVERRCSGTEAVAASCGVAGETQSHHRAAITHGAGTASGACRSYWSEVTMVKLRRYTVLVIVVDRIAFGNWSQLCTKHCTKQHNLWQQQQSHHGGFILAMSALMQLWQLCLAVNLISKPLCLAVT